MMVNRFLTMGDGKRFFSLLLVFVMSFFVVSCSKDPVQEPPAETPPNVKSYSQNGLDVKYPANWEFLYDDAPDLYASRGIGFQVSEFSNVRIVIDETQSLKLSALADRFEKELQLKSNKIASEYSRKPTTLGGYKGEKLAWTDSTTGSTKFEMTIVNIAEAPKTIFVVTHLSATDIANETRYIEFFVKNISLQ